MKKPTISILAHVGLCLVLFSFSAQPGHAASTTTPRIWSAEQNTSIYLPITDNPIGGFSLASGDLGLDGKPELIVGSGMGQEPRVFALRQDGSEVGSFLAYAPTLGVGINVAVCDLNNDGINEIITAPQRGGGPHIRVFNNQGIGQGIGTFVYTEGFRGGVNLACGDVIGDQQNELITFPGTGGGSHVRIWNFINGSLELKKEFFAFDALDTSGLVGTVDKRLIIVSQQHTQSPIVKTFSVEKTISMTEEKKISVNASGISSIVIHNQQRLLSTASNGYVLNLETGEEKKLDDFAYPQLLSVHKPDQQNELFVWNGKKLFNEDSETKIVVDISEQRLYAYTDGILDKTFLISSGKQQSTPLGNHSILAKIPQVHYKWSYGPNDPRNYDLGFVPYNLRFAPHLYLHYAYWHNNFGQPMSRGCINVSFENMQWLYNWAHEGIPVDVIS